MNVLLITSGKIYYSVERAKTKLSLFSSVLKRIRKEKKKSMQSKRLFLKKNCRIK